MSNYKWQSVKKPTYTKGRLVFHSDDGRIWDYIYFKIIQRAVTRGNQFNHSKSGIFCPAVNTAYTGEGDVPGYHESTELPTMTWNMLEEIATKGGEILSHGKYHLYMTGKKVGEAVNVGATRIPFNGSQGQPVVGIKFFIQEGDNRDDFTVTSYTLTGSNKGYMDIDIPLTHSYTSAATVNVHEDSMEEQLGGIIADLNAHGIERERYHHVNAWYLHSETSLPFLKQYFGSVVTESQSGDEGYVETIAPDIAAQDLYDITRQADLRFYSTEQIDALLEDVQEKDSVAFVQMHGLDNSTVFFNLDYMITKALEMGIRIVTHDEAIRYLKTFVEEIIPNEEHITSVTFSGAIKTKRYAEDFSEIYVSSVLGRESEVGYVHVTLDNANDYSITLSTKDTDVSMPIVSVDESSNKYTFIFTTANYIAGNIYTFNGVVKENNSDKTVQTFTLKYYKSDYVDSIITNNANRLVIDSVSDDFTIVTAHSIASGTICIRIYTDTDSYQISITLPETPSELKGPFFESSASKDTNGDTFYLISLDPKELTTNNIDSVTEILTLSGVNEPDVVLKTIKVYYTRTV